jgi:hypothetical protein
MQKLLPAACLGLLLACGAQADEIYKWVDKDGKTHYSSRREDAAGAQTTTMRPAPPVADGPPPSAASANEDIIRRRTAPEMPPQTAQAPVKKKTEIRVYGPETPEAKCHLAREAMAGRAVRRDGRPLDEWNRMVAENDIRVYCGKTSQ